MSTLEPTSVRGSVAAVALAAALAAGCALPGGTRPSTAPGHYGLGRAPTADEIRGWDIDVTPSGAGLRPGSGNVARGRSLYGERCMACHGADGSGATAPALAGGQGTLASPKPRATVGSYWPYATTLYDYIYRAMPFDSPQTLTADETYALTAYLLHVNGIVPADATLDARSLPAVKMPNRGGFNPVDPRPDTR